MCHDPDAVPPAFNEPRTPVSSARALVLTASDGNRLAAYTALPAEARGPAILVLPDNHGLSGFYENVCEQLAGHGHPALAVDYFGRTAGADHQARDAGFPFMEHLFKATRDGLYADIEAGLAHLRELGPVCTIGFCFGGRLAFLTADVRFGVAAAVGFYGFPGELFGVPGPTQLAAGFTAPILGLFGGADQGIPADAVAAFDAALTASGADHELVVYPGLPHGFFESGADATACADAWGRVLAFVASRDGKRR
jgi:carboxymethylenebutenolidase